MPTLRDSCQYPNEWTGHFPEACEGIAEDLVQLLPIVSKSIYVQSGMAVNVKSAMHGIFPEALHESLSKLGEYEYNLLDKIVRGDYDVLAIRGNVGSGKSTTLRYLHKYFISKLKSTFCCFCDLNNPQLRKINDAENVARTIFKVLPSSIEDALKATIKYNRSTLLESEYEFIRQAINGNDEKFGPWKCHYPESVLSLGHASVKGEVRKSNEEYLNYLISFLGFLSLESKIKEYNSFYLIFDNIDYIDAKAQRFLLESIGMNWRAGNVHFILTCRENVFFGYSDFFHACLVRDQKTPGIAKVLERRREVFENKIGGTERLQDCYGPLSDELRVGIIGALNKIAEMLKEGRGVEGKARKEKHPFLYYVADPMEGYVRSALIALQHFIIAPQDFLVKDKTQYHYIRQYFRLANERFDTEDRCVVCNVFQCEGRMGNGYPLLKPRMINMIHRMEKVYRYRQSSVNTIVKILKAFEYSDYAIYNALCDLERPACPIILITNYWYNMDEEKIEYGPKDRIYLTPLGEMYAERIMYSLDYFSEMINNIVIEGEVLGKIEGRIYTTERLYLEARVLRYMYEKERQENEELLTGDDERAREVSGIVYGGGYISEKMGEEMYEALIERVRAILVETREKEVLYDLRDIIREIINGCEDFIKGMPIEAGKFGVNVKTQRINKYKIFKERAAEIDKQVIKKIDAKN